MGPHSGELCCSEHSALPVVAVEDACWRISDGGITRFSLLSGGKGCKERRFLYIMRRYRTTGIFREGRCGGVCGLLGRVFASRDRSAPIQRGEIRQLESAAIFE